MTALLIVALLAAPDIRVKITPDQPLPFAYVDEPLIVEVSSPTEKEAVVRVEIDGRNGPAEVLDLGPVDLAESGAHWSALESVAQRRGEYRAKFTIAAGGITLQQAQNFCRIDRPVPGYTFPLSAAVNGSSHDNLALALSAMSGRSFRLEPGTPELAAKAEKARQAGLQVVIGLPLARLSEPVADAERLATELGDGVARWEIEGVEKPAAVAAVAEVIHRAQPRAGIGLVARDPAALARLFEAGAGKYAGTLVLDEQAPERDALLALRSEAERAGYEGMTLVALNRGIEPGMLDQSQWLLKQVLMSFAAGAESILDADLILNGKGFGGAYVALCGTAQRLRNASYAGELELHPGVRTEVLRTPERWVLVLWAKSDPQDLALRLPQARELELTDVRNNPLDLPPMAGDVLTMRVGLEPLFLSGKGGTLLADAARRMAVEEAKAILDDRDAKQFPTELAELLQLVTEQGSGAIDRRGFLALVGVFQGLEEAYRAGKLPTEIAVPTSAGLARLLRHLCVVEHERGEPFLEPLQAMLEKCSEYTSKYLTGAPNGEGYRRDDWILAEVTRLMAEAKQLQDAGRATEADAVAALAEGRARALQR